MATSASIAVRAGRSEGTISSFTGPWALFRLFHDVEGWTNQGNIQVPEWPVRINGRQVMDDRAEVKLRAELHLPSAGAVVWSGYFSGLGCVAEVAR